MVPTRQMYPEDERQGVLVVREDGGCPRRETGTIALWPARHPYHWKQGHIELPSSRAE